MVRDQGAFRLHNPWPKIAWAMVAVIMVVSTVLGFGVISLISRTNRRSTSGTQFAVDLP